MSFPSLNTSVDTLYTEMSTFRDGSLILDHDVDYQKLVAGKNVAVVGPARTLVGGKQGAFIDTHDLVVRFNETFEHLPFANALAEDIGTKTDILYCNQVILRKNVLSQKGSTQEKFIKSCHEAQIKYIVCTNNSLSFTRSGQPSTTCEKQDRHVITDFHNFLKGSGLTTKFRNVYSASELLSKWLHGNWARTGFVAIVDLLAYEMNRLFVTGMTFYHRGGHLFAPESAELHPLKNRDGTWARDKSGIGHNSYLELEIMKLLARSFEKKLMLDESLLKLLQQEANEA